MSHFAKINNQNIVTDVIVAEQDFINSGAVGDPKKWIQTSYNTRNGVHIYGGTPLRANYASIGYVYHPEYDIFSPPKPYPSFILNTTTGQWEAPVPCPEHNLGENYVWDEASLSYKRVK